MSSRPSRGVEDGLSQSATVNIRFALAEFPEMDTLAAFTEDGTLHVSQRWYREPETCGTVDEVTKWLAWEIIDCSTAVFETEIEAVAEMGCPLVFDMWWPKKEPDHHIAPARLGWLPLQIDVTTDVGEILLRDLRQANRAAKTVSDVYDEDPGAVSHPQFDDDHRTI